MKYISKFISSLTSVVSNNTTSDQNADIRSTLQNMIDVNIKYEQKFHEHVPTDTLIQQTPNATALFCSDSRVETKAFDQSPAGQIFTIRNIGNQIHTAFGSVVFGIDYLHTPLLLIIGHSGCGAITAALEEYKSSSEQLAQELATLNPNLKASLNDNVVLNVNQQVEIAVDKFAKKVKDGSLTVIGLVYDLHNDFKYGSGRLILVNINNETDPKIIAKKPYIQDLNNLTILGASQ